LKKRKKEEKQFVQLVYWLPSLPW